MERDISLSSITSASFQLLFYGNSVFLGSFGDAVDDDQVYFSHGVYCEGNYNTLNNINRGAKNRRIGPD